MRSNEAFCTRGGDQEEIASYLASGPRESERSQSDPGPGWPVLPWRNPEPGHTLTWPPQTPARLLTHNQGCQVHIYPVEFIGRRSEVFCSNTLLLSMVLTSKTDGYCVKIVELWKGDQRYTQLLMSFVHFVVRRNSVCGGWGMSLSPWHQCSQCNVIIGTAARRRSGRGRDRDTPLALMIIYIDKPLCILPAPPSIIPTQTAGIWFPTLRRPLSDLVNSSEIRDVGSEGSSRSCQFRVISNVFYTIYVTS